MGHQDDWLMKQVQGMANVIGKFFRLEISQLDLGSVEDQEGNRIDGAVYLENLLASENFSQASRFIKSQMKTLNHHEYSLLVEDYMTLLLGLDEQVLFKHHLDRDSLAELKADLLRFEW